MKTLILLILAASAALPVFADPTSRPATTAPADARPARANAPAALPQSPAVAAMRAQREAQKKGLQNTPDGGACKLEDLIHFSLQDGRLASEWVGTIPPGQARRIKIEGSPATWLVNRFNNGPTAFYSLTRFDFDAPDDDLWMIQFSFQQGVNVTSIYAQGGATSEISRLFFTQMNNTVMLNLSCTGDNNRTRQLLNARAADLFHLRADHPDEVCRHLLPLLRKLTGQPILSPGAGDVYRTFTDIPADPAITRRIEALLPALSSIDPIERNRATKSLRDLGAPGVLAAARYDREFLLPEQANRLSDFVNLHSPVTLANPADFDRDENFLLDCLDDADPAVRIAAKSALEKLLGRSVPFDPAAPAANRTTALATLRQKLARTAAQRREIQLLEFP